MQPGVRPYFPRWEDVRSLSAAGWGPPMIWDARAASAGRYPFAPYRCEEWWWDRRNDRWVPVPVIAGGSFDLATGQQPLLTLGHPELQSTAVTALDLDSNYVYNTGGDAIGARHVLAEDKTLTAIYFGIASYGGTAASVTSLNIELRNDGGSGPGSTAHASETIDPASATGWIKKTGLSVSLSADTVYHAIVGDADGSTPNFARAIRNISGSMSFWTRAGRSAASQTTGGWASGVTWPAFPGSIVLVFSDGTAQGVPYLNFVSNNNTNQKGWRIEAGLFPVPVAVFSYSATTAFSNNLSGLNIWRDGQGPSGSPSAGYSTTRRMLQASTGTPTVAGFQFPRPLPRLDPRCGYDITFSYSGSHTGVTQFQIWTGADATLRRMMLGAGKIYYSESNGTTSWANRQADSFPSGEIVVNNFVEPGASLRTRPRLTR